MLYKGSNITTKLPEKMVSAAPVKIGTRGTVGSLVMKEIEYFKRCELELPKQSVDHVGSSSSSTTTGSGVSSSSSWPSFGFSLMTWRKKKKRGTSLLSRICSTVEVSNSHRLNGVPSFNYINLKADVKNFQV